MDHFSDAAMNSRIMRFRLRDMVCASFPIVDAAKPSGVPSEVVSEIWRRFDDVNHSTSRSRWTEMVDATASSEGQPFVVWGTTNFPPGFKRYLNEIRFTALHSQHL